jgi:hypothetical protein
LENVVTEAQHSGESSTKRDDLKEDSEEDSEEDKEDSDEDKAPPPGHFPRQFYYLWGLE